MPEPEPSPRPQPDTAELLRASRTGDRAALEALLQQHLPGLQAFARLRMSPLVRARLSSEDLVQSACCELLAALDGLEYRGEEAFRGWLYTSVLNKLRERERSLRAQKRDPRRETALRESGAGPEDRSEDLAASYARVLSPSQILIGEERVRALEAAFDALPEQYREVLTLARLARLGREEIAKQMGRTEASVRNLLTRALVVLSARLDRPDSEGGG